MLKKMTLDFFLNCWVLGFNCCFLSFWPLSYVELFLWPTVLLFWSPWSRPPRLGCTRSTTWWRPQEANPSTIRTDVSTRPWRSTWMRPLEKLWRHWRRRTGEDGNRLGDVRTYKHAVELSKQGFFWWWSLVKQCLDWSNMTRSRKGVFDNVWQLWGVYTN